MRQLQSFGVDSDLPNLAPFPRYVAEQLGLFVRIGNDVLKTVVFVGIHPDGGKFLPLGTGFLVSTAVETVAFVFVVTARHVLESIEGPDIAVRYNDSSGRTVTIKVPLAHCSVTKDRAKDVAILPISIDPTAADHMFIPMDRKEWEGARREVWEEKLGDEIVTLGLYSSHFGELKNIPVVRVGHIAMMPGEPVRTSFGYVQAYLVEVKSIAGLSGSPVFLNVPDFRLNSKQELEYMPDRTPIPIGMMLGYHVVESAEDQIPVAQFQGEEPPTQRSLDERNTGFAVVLPMPEILAIFENPGMQNSMKKAAEMVLKKNYRPAGIVVPKASSDEVAADRMATPTAANNPPNPHHKEDFTSLLNAASKKPIPDR